MGRLHSGFMKAGAFFIGLAAAGLPLMAGQSAESAETPSVPVLAAAGAETDALTARGAALVADYGEFKVYDWHGAPGEEPAAGEAKPEWRQLKWNTGVVETDGAEMKAAMSRFVGAPKPGVYVVQFAAPPQPGWVEALEKSGAKIIDVIPENGYLVYGSGASVTALSRLNRKSVPIHWMGEMRAEWKVQPFVPWRLTTGKNRQRVASGDRFHVQMVNDAVANEGTLNLIGAGARGPIESEQLVGERRTVTLRLDPALIEALAGQPDVIAISTAAEMKKNDERQNRIVTGQITAAGLPNGPGHMAWLAANGFTQESIDATNIVVDVTDSGVDNGTVTPNHFALRRGGVFNATSRLVYSRLVGTPNTGSSLQGCDGHGTLQAHIIGGFSNLAANTAFHRDAQGYQYGLGINPFVRMGTSVIFDFEKFTNPVYSSLTSQAFNNGARVSNNSWGGFNFGLYDANAQAYDALVRDAQPTGATVAVAGNQQMTIVFAAGNEGPMPGTIGTPATAKNVISVGATENQQNFGGTDACGTTDAESDNPEQMAGFSSRGPTYDGRIKPDLVAPGTHVSGGNFTANVVDPAVAANPGTAAPCFNASGVCAGPGSSRHFPANGQRFYTASSGTSHASPSVAGGASLIYDWYRRVYGGGSALPSPAMVKALLANGARWINGSGAGHALPSSLQGFGMMNLDQTIATGARILRDQVPADTFTASLQTRTFTGRIQDHTRPTRITLAWTDKEGSVGAAPFVNRLSLRVLVNNRVYYGNNFSGGNSVPDGTPDTINNLQSVVLPANSLPANAAISITVTAHTIAGDGVPNSGPALDQDFALVAFNVVEQARAFPLAAVTFAGTGGNANTNAFLEPGESGVAMTLTTLNAGTASLPAGFARLTSASPGVRVVQGLAPVPALAAGATASATAHPFVVAVDPTLACDSSANFFVTYFNNNEAFTGSQFLTFPLRQSGTPAQVAQRALTGLNRTFGTTAANSNLVIDIPVTGAGVLERMDVRLRLTHTFISDNFITLESPDGTRAKLFWGWGGSGDNLNNTLFTDTASTFIGNGTPPYSGSFRPDQPLSRFAGKPIAGTWRLYVADFIDGDSGTLQDVTLTFYRTGCAAPLSTGVFHHTAISNYTETGTFNTDLGPTNAFLQAQGLGNRTRNSGLARISLQTNAVPLGGPSRAFGILENPDTDMPYSAVGTDRFVRATFSVAYTGPGDSASPTLYNLVPNMRFRAGIRFVQTAMLNLNHNTGTGDPAAANIARELGPSRNYATPSIYKVDFDPIEVPQITGDPTQGIQRGFETFAFSPDYTYVNGTLHLLDSTIGHYPRPNLSATPVKTYASGGTAGNADFDNPDVNVFSASVDRLKALGEGVIDGLVIPEPSITATRAPAGVTYNTSGAPTNRIAILATDFLSGNNADRTNRAGRIRVAPDQLYVASFRVKSAGNTSTHPFLRFRVRSIKFQYSVALELGGRASVGSTQGQNIAIQTLPGVGNQVAGTTGDGTVYNVVFPTPIDLDIRRDRTGTAAARFPVIMAQPAEGVNADSLRDLRIGYDVIDSLSVLPESANEAAINTQLNRVEIRRFPAPRN